MSRFPAILSAVALLALAPAVAVAQSDDAIASVTVAGDGNVTVINTAGLSFGIQPSGAIVHSSDVPTAASWNVGFNQAADYVMTFSLPSELATGTGLSVPRQNHCRPLPSDRSTAMFQPGSTMAFHS